MVLWKNTSILFLTLLLIILIIFFAWWLSSLNSNPPMLAISFTLFYKLAILSSILVITTLAASLYFYNDRIGPIRSLIFLIIVIIDILTVFWLLFSTSQTSLRSALIFGIMIILLMSWIIGTYLININFGNNIAPLVLTVLSLIFMICLETILFISVETRK